MTGKPHALHIWEGYLLLLFFFSWADHDGLKTTSSKVISNMGKWRSKMTWFGTNCNPDPTVSLSEFGGNCGYLFYHSTLIARATSVVTGNGVFHCQRGYNTYMAPAIYRNHPIGPKCISQGPTQLPHRVLLPFQPARFSATNRRGARFGDPAGVLALGSMDVHYPSIGTRGYCSPYVYS